MMSKTKFMKLPIEKRREIMEASVTPELIEYYRNALDEEASGPAGSVKTAMRNIRKGTHELKESIETVFAYIEYLEAAKRDSEFIVRELTNQVESLRSDLYAAQGAKREVDSVIDNTCDKIGHGGENDDLPSAVAVIMHERDEAREKLKELKADLDTLETNVGAVYCHVTNNKISKPFTDPYAVMSVHDDECSILPMELQVKLDEATEENAALRRACKSACETLIELNLNNYNHDDVQEANNATIEACGILTEALRGEGEKS